MSEKQPDPNSRRTWERAADLAFGRGCDPDNDCWRDCVESGVYAIVDRGLTDEDKQIIHDQRKLRHAK